VTLPTRPIREILYADRPLPELLDEAAAEILGNLRALAHAAFEHRVCDLTGGMDSRLVAAAILHDGLQDAFLFHTIGGHPNPDANVAALIRERFGLRRGTAIHPPPDRERTPFEWLRTTLGETSGVMSTFFKVRAADPEPSRHLWIGGGSGELLREFWPSGGPPAGSIARLLRRRPPPLRRNVERLRARGHLLRPERREEAAETLARFGAESVAAGVAAEHVGDHLYLASRARYHFGVFWATSPRARFHPLYSPAALQAAHAIPNGDKAANRIGLELMRRLAPELAALPFAGKRWAPHLMPEAPEPVTRRTPPLAEGPADGVAIHPRPEREARLPDETERRLKAAGAKPRQVELGRMLEEVRAAGIDLDPIGEVFDLAAVRAFLDRPPEALAKGTGTDDAYRVLAAAVWAQGLEIGPG
jgi:asparagine synthetase B (glutamine-hydrolysing)